MLATSVTSLPTGDAWGFEFKWDGVRALLDVSDRGVHLYSRRGSEITAAYPELVAQALAPPGVPDVLLDGEIVAFVDGRPSFHALQSRMHVRGVGEARKLAEHMPVTYVVFDILRNYGVDLTSRPYSERRETLTRWADERDGWTVSPSFDDGPATVTAAREHALEGVVAKKLTSIYRPGIRSADWAKLRFARSGDFVVVGWEGPDERPRELSSLVLAYQRDGELAYVGKVGSGLSGRTARQLQGMLSGVDACVLDELPPPSPSRTVHWTSPEVVVEVEFASWTDDGRLRHPVFRGIRTDKTADEATGDG